MRVSCCALAIAVWMAAFSCKAEDGPTPGKEGKVILVTDEWSPYYGSGLKEGGFLADIAKTAFKRVGIECEVQFFPWNRAFNTAKNGMYDGVLGGFYLKEREAYFAFSKPIGESHLVFVSWKNSGISWKKLEDLRNHSIGTVRGYRYTNAFDDAAWLEKIPAASTEANLKLLVDHRLDLMLDAREVVLYLLKTTYPGTQVDILDPPLATNALHVMFSKKCPEWENKVKAFDRGLAMIKADGTVSSIMAKSGLGR
jgi:polar amino acid transport system substrate-binding protein